MKWRKLGHVFVGSGQLPWTLTHATTPFAVSRGDAVRCYFSSRDDKNRSHIGYLDIDPAKPDKILQLSKDPLLSPGETGAFDDSGVSMVQIVEQGGKRYLYYVGWNLGVTVPFRNSIGLAIADAGSERFERVSRAPVLDRHRLDPFSLSAPWVLAENGAWKMWYGSHLAWEKDGMDMVYAIKYAISADGMDWQRDGNIVLDVVAGESAVSTPCVLHENGGYRMWYTRRIGRKETCLVGYAESKDGLSWQRRDELAGIEASSAGWDSQMVCYPRVLDHKGARYMIYCGNHFGAGGFGIAVLEHE